MKKIIVVCLSALSFSALSAEIKYGNSPMFGSQMKIDDKGNLVGNLADLEESGAGEDEEFVLSCYKGEPKGVCELLRVATREMNQAEKLPAQDRLVLSSCTVINSSYSQSEIRASFSRKSRQSKLPRFRIGLISLCR